jgi:hypothetical protein
MDIFYSLRSIKLIAKKLDRVSVTSGLMGYSYVKVKKVKRCNFHLVYKSATVNCTMKWCMLQFSLN